MTDGLDPAFWQTFRHGHVQLETVALHYVEGGRGEPILLIPGWPQSWYAWRHVMPRLVAAGRRVVTIDPRGFGDSDKPLGPYDLGTIAGDVHALIEKLDLRGPGGLDIAGHDIGTWIAWAHAADHPGDVRRVALLDALLPGLSTPPAAIPSPEMNLRSWHFAFNRLDDLPETLIAGRERAFLTWLFRAKSMRPTAIGPADLDEYVRILEAPGALRSGMAYYRAAFGAAGLLQARTRAERRLTMPVLALGAERGVGDALRTAMAGVAITVAGGALAGCGHYMPEEAPAEVADALLAFFSDSALPAGETRA